MTVRRLIRGLFKWGLASAVGLAVLGVIALAITGVPKPPSITKEGLGFIGDRFSIIEFFGSARWAPTSSHNPTYGALALIAGTASVTGLAMLVAVPFSLGAAIYIGEFASGKTRESLKILVEMLAAIPSAKLKTGLQIVAISLLILNKQLGEFEHLAPTFLWLAMLASVCRPSRGSHSRPRYSMAM